jgi:hypothetical protein
MLAEMDQLQAGDKLLVLQDENPDETNVDQLLDFMRGPGPAPHGGPSR